MAQRDGLQDDVTEGSRFDRASYDFASRGVRSELIEQTVLAATTDDVHYFNFQSGDFFHLSQSAIVEQREAFQDATGNGPR